MFVLQAKRQKVTLTEIRRVLWILVSANQGTKFSLVALGNSMKRSQKVLPRWVSPWVHRNRAIFCDCNCECQRAAELRTPRTCYRATRWPDPEFPQKIPKKQKKPSRNSGTPRKCPQNIPKKIPKMGALGIFGGYFFSVFRGIFGGKFWESPCPIWLDDRGTGQWKWLEEVPRRTSLVPLAFPCLYIV